MADVASRARRYHVVSDEWRRIVFPDPQSADELTLGQGAAEKQADGTDRHGQQDENYAERQRQAEIAFAGLERDRSRHRARVAADIATDNDDCADLGDGAAKGSKKGGQQSIAADIHQWPYCPKARGAIDQERLAIGMPMSHRRAVNQRDDDRQAKQTLRDYHGRRRKQNAERAERSRPR